MDHRFRTKNFLVLISLLVLTSCVSFHTTTEGGFRVDNSKVFKYNKPRYTSRDKSAIDVNAIYLLDSVYNKWDAAMDKKSVQRFVRFFPTGQVLFVRSDGMPTLDLINNPNVGIPGYFIIDGDKIKIDMFQMLNGGQTGKYYGKVTPDGNIMFYEQRPETFYGSFAGLEKSGMESFWKKIKVGQIENYKPNW